MRTKYSEIKYAINGMLKSDEPLLETAIIKAPAKDITSIAFRMGMKVWIRQCLVVDPGTLKAEKMWKVGIKTLPPKGKYAYMELRI